MKKIKKLFVLFSVFTLMLTGCFNKGNSNKNNVVNVDELVKKFSENSQYDYDREIREVSSTDAIRLKIKAKEGWNVNIFADFEERNADTNKDSTTKILSKNPVELYYDFNLTSRMWSSFAKREETELVLIPQNDLTVYSEKSKFPLYSKGNWGSLDYFYLVQYNDLETGKLLAKPKVITYKVNHENNSLKSPKISYNINSKGALELTWDKVEGATQYHIINLGINYFYDNVKQQWSGNISAVEVDRVNDNKWNSISDKDKAFLVNQKLRATNVINEDLELGKLQRNKNDKLNDETDNTRPENNNNIVVIASNGMDYSPMSNRIFLPDVVKTLPYSVALNEWKQKVNYNEERNSIFSFKNISDLPKEIPVSMCDGKTRYVPIDINFEKTALKKSTRGDVLVVHLNMKGTPFEEQITIENFGANYTDELKNIQKSIDESIFTGNFRESTTYIEEKEIATKSKKVSESIPNVKDDVFGTSALSYYLSANMIDKVDIIDISKFPEAQDPNVLYNALNEATFQNPTIPFVLGYNISSNRKKVEVLYYDKDKDLMEKKQDEIRQKLNEVAEKISSNSNLSELEKVRAINNYVVDFGEYDYSAYENRDKFNNATSSTGVDINLAEAYSTYGIANKGKGVCISYAKTFTYLARKVGLESVVVTGYVNGNAEAGHAWNAVKIDGKWKYFDSTWNDGNGESKEKYFNLIMDDEIFSKTHTLDSNYIVPANINKYR